MFPWRKALLKMQKYPLENEEPSEDLAVAEMVKLGITAGGVCLREEKKYLCYKRKGSDDE